MLTQRNPNCGKTRVNRLALLLLLASAIVVGLSGASFAQLRPMPESNEVAIHATGVELPLNRILLIRKGSSYCALKFTNAWYEMDQARLNSYASMIEMGGIAAESARDAARKKYATYESYYESGYVSTFSNQRLHVEKKTASLLPTQGPFHPFTYQPGNGCVECGTLKLLWSDRTGVSFIPLGKGSSMKDYGIELAPAPWTDIKEANVFDHRVKWFRYDARRQSEFISIDKLWQELHRDRSNDVVIGGGGVEVPLGRILLIRHDSDYCAMRFTKYWRSSDGKRLHASYESYYSEQGAEGFTAKAFKAAEDSVYLKHPQRESNPTKRPDNEQVKCGPTRLYWEGNGFVSFLYDGWGRGYPLRPVELTPTPWTDFSQIKVHDGRVKWYKNDFIRKNVWIPIDKLWEHDSKKHSK